MKVILKEGFSYTPEWNNNKKAKKEDQIVVKFKFLSGANFSELIGDDGKTDMLKEWLVICESVTNLEINNIKVTPEGLYNISGLADLYIELKLAFKAETIIDKKKLK